MKKLIFSLYICIFALSLAVGSKIGSSNENYNICLTETNVSEDDLFTIHDIVHDRHKQSENQEKIKKNGCVVQCLLQKAGVMEGSEYDIEKLHIDFTKKTNAQPGDNIFQALDNCINETKDLTEKCEKSFALMECFIKAKEKINPHTPDESHEEHEHEHASED